MFAFPGGILGGGGGGGGDDDDEDFGLTRFLGGATDFVTDFLGVNSNEKKKPNEGINIDRRNDEKLKKKPEIVKKTPKNSPNKLKSEADDQNEDSVIETIEKTIEELAADGEEQTTDSPIEKTEPTEAEHEESDETDATEKEYEDEDEEDDVSIFLKMISNIIYIFYHCK